MYKIAGRGFAIYGGPCSRGVGFLSTVALVHIFFFSCYCPAQLICNLFEHDIITDIFQSPLAALLRNRLLNIAHLQPSLLAWSGFFSTATFVLFLYSCFFLCLCRYTPIFVVLFTVYLFLHATLTVSSPHWYIYPPPLSLFPCNLLPIIPWSRLRRIPIRIK